MRPGEIKSEAISRREKKATKLCGFLPVAARKRVFENKNY